MQKCEMLERELRMKDDMEELEGDINSSKEADKENCSSESKK
jgi:hypothetical protein